MSLVKTQKQIEAINKMKSNTVTLLEGGARSGKTVIIEYAIIVRALHYPGSWHLTGRLRLSHARTSLWQKTIPDVLKMLGLRDIPKYNDKEMVLTFPNGPDSRDRYRDGSKIIVFGLDDKERTEKILGNEYDTLHLNEISQISYDTYELVTTRMNPHKNVPGRIFLDHNPGTMAHWAYKIFHERKFPDGRSVSDNDYGHIRINPIDNQDNISSELMSRLNNLSGPKRLRFLEGGYGSEEGALWQRSWFRYGIPPIDLIRVVIGVDPSGSEAGDEIGIIAAGVDSQGKKYILGDYSMHGTPKEWGEEVIRVYELHNADLIVAEKNFGGDMVEAVITDMGRKSVNYEAVTASRGKIARAEPISAMYQNSEVTHCGELITLEDEMCTYKPTEIKNSPNHMDAAVWALTALSQGIGLEAYVRNEYQ